MVIGINDMDNVKTIERLNEIGKELQKIETQERSNQKRHQSTRKIFYYS